MTLEEFYKRFDFNSDASGSVIGRGGFGVVYKAYDKVRKRFVAVKRSEVGQFAKFDLLYEVEIANEIDPHPNILRYENVFRISENLSSYDYAIMKFYPEGNLETVLRKNQLNETEQKQILRGILEGLAHIHSIPIIHRDFKTANILMDKSPTGEWIPLICDFGQSRLVDTEQSIISNNSQIALTPKYSAPEQLLDEKSLRPNADLWAFGVMTYQIVQGKLPFTVDDVSGEWGRSEKIRFLILQGELPKDIDAIREPYQEIIRRCLVVDPEKRVKNATDLLKLMDNEVKKTIVKDIKPPVQPKEPDKTAILPKAEILESPNHTLIASKTVINDKKTDKIETNEPDIQTRKGFNYWLLLPIAATIAIGLFFLLRTPSTKQEPIAKVQEPIIEQSKDTIKSDMVAQSQIKDEIKKEANTKTTAESVKPDKVKSQKETEDFSVKGTQSFSSNSNMGTIVITINEDCEVSIDGKRYGKIRAGQSRDFNLEGRLGDTNSKVHIFTFNNGQDEITENISVYAGKTFSKQLNF